jgi:hypothetical protein
MIWLAVMLSIEKKYLLIPILYIINIIVAKIRIILIRCSERGLEI